MAIIYNNSHQCRVINYCVMYITQHNDGRAGEVGKRRGREEREGDKEGVEVRRRKDEEREGTEGERKITFCKVRWKERKRERERERERGRLGEEDRGKQRRAVKGRRRE